MNIAVIGQGAIGTTLAQAWTRAGHTVVHGSRTGSTPGSQPDPPVDSTAAPVTGLGDAIARSQVIVLALPGTAVPDLLATHADALAGKLVVDATNVIGRSPAHARAAVDAAAPTARYARAFNTLGVENLVDPHYGDAVADMFYSSSQTDRTTVEALIGAVGLRPIYVGPDSEDLLDGVLRLWFALAISQERGRNIAFRVLERETPS